MADFICGLCLGIVMGLTFGVCTLGPDRHKIIEQKELHKQCLFPVLSNSFLAEPFTKTCFYIQGTNKTVIDCKPVLFMPEFVDVKGCF